MIRRLVDLGPDVTLAQVDAFKRCWEELDKARIAHDMVVGGVRVTVHELRPQPSPRWKRIAAWKGR